MASRWRQDGARRARAKKERHYFYTGADIDHLLAQAAHTTGPGDGTVAEAVVSSKVTFHRAASVQLSVLGSCQLAALSQSLSTWTVPFGSDRTRVAQNLIKTDTGFSTEDPYRGVDTKAKAKQLGQPASSPPQTKIFPRGAPAAGKR